MMKVLFIVDQINYGGVSKVLVDMLAALDITRIYWEVVSIYENDERRIKELPYNVATIFKKIKPGEEKWLKLLPASVLRNKVEYQKFDKIVLYGNKAINIYGPIFSKQKYCCWLHDNPVYTDGMNFSNYKTIKSKFTLYRKRKAYEYAEKIVCVSHECKKIFEKVWGYSEKTIALHNIVDVNYTREMAKQYIPLEFSDGECNIVSVGRLSSEKAFERLIRVVCRLKVHIPNVKLFIIGEGEKKNNLLKLIEDSDAQSYVKLLGLKKNPYPYILNADLFVSSSISEAYSTVAVETLILGTPAIVTAACGMKEIMGNTKGGVVCQNSEEALYEEISKMLSDTKRLEEYKGRAVQASQCINMEQEIQHIENFLGERWD